MRKPDLCRRKESDRNLITLSLQVSDNSLKSSLDVSVDILEEAVAGSDDPDAVKDPRPEMPGVIFAPALPGVGEGLAGITARKEIHRAMKVRPWEGLEIRPDRSGIQEAPFNLCEQVCDRKCFPLTVSDGAKVSQNSFESEINPSVAGTE
jgi:hypothetical protein